MTDKKHTWKSCLALATCMVAVPLMLGCVEKEENHYLGVHSFIVKVIPQDGQFGSADAPLKFPTTFSDMGQCPEDETCYDVSVGAYAVDIEGNFLPDYNETVHINAEPGKLSVDTITFTNGVVGQWARDANGKPTTLLSGQTVGMRYTHGSTRIWVEDTDRRPATVMGCLNDRITEDKRYCEPTMASGVSEEFTFESQTIKMLQYNPEQLDGDSPLLKKYGQLKAQKGHDLVVTNIVATGFYITDLGDPDYNSIFIFTYSQPARVEIGDRVCEVAGGVAEYTGMTQLQFPSWGIQNKERSTAEDTDPAPEDGDQGVGSCVDKKTGEVRPCTDEEIEAMNALVDCSDVYYDRPLTKEEKKAFAYIEPPEPRVISPDLLALKAADSKNASTGYDGSRLRTNPVQTNALERLESSVVTLQNVRLSTEFINCDDNGNSKIESGTAEAECRTKCQTSGKRCTELSNLENYDQWLAWTLDGNAEISVASSTLIADFDILAGCYSWIDPSTNRKMMRCPERHLKRLTGNLKQILPGCSGANSASACYASKFAPAMVMSVIEPRIKNDLILDEAYNKVAEAAFQRCISDTRPGGCLETCKAYGGFCTCEDFAKYRQDYPPTDPTLPLACL